MFRTPLIAALTVGLSVALMGTAALAAPANSQPPPGYDDDYGPPPPGYDSPGYNNAQRSSQADRDLFCRRDAAARTGYTTPGEAAHDEQVRGSVGGTLGGAALGAIIGAGAGNAGMGAAIGAGAGLLAGTAIGADNANHAARDVQADYADAYYACMHEDGGRTAQSGYDAPPPGYGYPPPAYYGYGPSGYPYYPYYYGPGYYGPGYYGPSVSVGFGFGGGYRGGFHHH